MGRKILIMGDSGQGKSYSTRNLDPNETFYIQCTTKDIPYKGAAKMYTTYDSSTGKGNLLSTNDWEQVCNAVKHINGKLPHIKVIIVDDVQYLMSFEFVRRAMEKGYDKFSEMCQHFFEVLTAPDKTRKDLTTVYFAHAEYVSVDGVTKTIMKTCGKMTEEKITPVGLFSVVLMSYAYTKQDKTTEYVFVTQTNGNTPAKSPPQMFDNKIIPNDLKDVLTKMKQYYEGE
jgi:hypothetical protein